MHESRYFAFALEPVCFISNPEIRIDRKCHSEAAGHCITSKGLKGTDGYLALTSPSSWSIDFSPQRPSLKSIYLICWSFEHFFRSLYSYLLFCWFCLSLLWFLHKVQYLAGCPLTSAFIFFFFLLTSQRLLFKAVISVCWWIGWFVRDLYIFPWPCQASSIGWSQTKGLLLGLKLDCACIDKKKRKEKKRQFQSHTETMIQKCYKHWI